MAMPRLYILRDRKSGYFYNKGVLSDEPNAYTKKGAERVLAEYGRVKRRKRDSWNMNYELRYYTQGSRQSYGHRKWTKHICDFDVIECRLIPIHGGGGLRRGCKPKGRRKAVKAVKAT